MTDFISLKSDSNETIVAVAHIRQIHHESNDKTVVISLDYGTIRCANVKPEEWAALKKRFGCS